MDGKMYELTQLKVLSDGEFVTKDGDRVYTKVKAIAVLGGKHTEYIGMLQDKETSGVRKGGYFVNERNRINALVDADSIDAYKPHYRNRAGVDGVCRSEFKVDRDVFDGAINWLLGLLKDAPEGGEEDFGRKLVAALQASKNITARNKHQRDNRRRKDGVDVDDDDEA